MGPIPTGVFLTKGVGKHREKLNAFELALRSAQIAKRVGCSVRHVRRILASLDNPHAPDSDDRSPDVLADAHP